MKTLFFLGLCLALALPSYAQLKVEIRSNAPFDQLEKSISEIRDLDSLMHLKLVLPATQLPKAKTFIGKRKFNPSLLFLEEAQPITQPNSVEISLLLDDRRFFHWAGSTKELTLGKAELAAFFASYAGFTRVADIELPGACFLGTGPTSFLKGNKSLFLSAAGSSILLSLDVQKAQLLSWHDFSDSSNLYHHYLQLFGNEKNDWRFFFDGTSKVEGSPKPSIQVNQLLACEAENLWLDLSVIVCGWENGKYWFASVRYWALYNPAKNCFLKRIDLPQWPYSLSIAAAVLLADDRESPWRVILEKSKPSEEAFNFVHKAKIQGDSLVLMQALPFQITQNKAVSYMGISLCLEKAFLYQGRFLNCLSSSYVFDVQQLRGFNLPLTTYIKPKSATEFNVSSISNFSTLSSGNYRVLYQNNLAMPILVEFASDLQQVKAVRCLSNRMLDPKREYISSFDFIDQYFLAYSKDNHLEFFIPKAQ